MAISESVGRIGAALIAMVQTRLELAAVEIEEESRRLLGSLVLALMSLILFGIAMLLVALTIVMVFWDSYRLEAASGLAALFTLAGAFIALKVRSGFAAKPPLLAATLAELNKDINYVRNAGHSNDA